MNELKTIEKAQAPELMNEVLLLMQENARQTQSLLKGMHNFDRKLTSLEETVNTFKDSAILDPREQYYIKQAVSERVATICKVNDLEYKKASKLLFSALWRELKDEFKIPSYQWIRKVDFRSAKNLIAEFVLTADLSDKITERMK